MSGRSDLTFRSATTDDLDDIVQLLWDGFSHDPEVFYRFPKRDEYPEEYRKWTRKEYQDYLQNRQKFCVSVIEAAVEADGELKRKPIAIAVWDFAVTTNIAQPNRGFGESRSLDIKRCQAYSAALSRCFEDYFAKYKEKQVHLCLLVTHPDFRRRGAASRLVKWGIQQGNVRGWDINFRSVQGWPVTVFASPMGELLYTHLGFAKIATEHVQVEGEEEKLTFAVMERDADWDPAKTVEKSENYNSR